MLTRRSALKKFVSTVVAGGMALVGLRPAKASPAFRPVKSDKWVVDLAEESVKDAATALSEVLIHECSGEGVVTSIRRSGSSLQHFDFDFGSHKACITAEHRVTIIRNGHREIRPVKDVRLGDTMCLPKYLAEPWVRKAMMGHK